MENKKFNFKENTAQALLDSRLRKNLKFAMGAMIQKRRAVFSNAQELEKLRVLGNSIRRRALSKLPELLEKLENKCTENGIIVHWAETTNQACEIVLEIMQKHKADKLVKGKSMVSEEMHLNKFLEQHGIEAIETDLGEFIIQLAGETPSHIIVPAIHKNKDEISKLFHEKIPGTPYTEEVEELNAIARKTLRKMFYEGHVGLSGVNMAAAETGTLCLVENEGNGRMCTTVPPVHIAVMGLEKVVEKLEDIPPLIRLLTGSATGQLITTYVNMITSPRKAGEKDGPKEIHLVILDNGRSKILADPQLRQTLQCIRCGTCLNHCPVYTRIGGHAYGFVYPGPIGKILTPQMEGLEKAGAMTTASSLCNACEEVCPVKIPIPELIRRLRNESYDLNGTVQGHGYKKHFMETAAWKAWELVNRIPALNAASTKMAGLFGHMLPKAGPLKEWTHTRTKPVFAQKSLHETVKEQGVAHE
ncbi:Putative lactate utilization protein B, LutB-like [Desulfonema limicola]|uniref:Lactate utilization protein B, LutB-like n=1 Tax=Desulfonema limicola TaxID=45656 RepID=A0A975BB91_9BACT|nr:LutB/LldF family L-lactate oxidation iron-sulfur protein [Desulfonema limicola]QTA82127.1 Putative lactate utilization protein B, LutB-like [Desulfonema limicola]